MDKRNKDKVRMWGAESKKIAEKGKKNWHTHKSTRRISFHKGTCSFPKS